MICFRFCFLPSRQKDRERQFTSVRLQTKRPVQLMQSYRSISPQPKVALCFFLRYRRSQIRRGVHVCKQSVLTGECRLFHPRRPRLALLLPSPPRCFSLTLNTEKWAEPKSSHLSPLSQSEGSSPLYLAGRGSLPQVCSPTSNTANEPKWEGFFFFFLLEAEQAPTPLTFSWGQRSKGCDSFSLCWLLRKRNTSHDFWTRDVQWKRGNDGFPENNMRFCGIQFFLRNFRFMFVHHRGNS